MNSVGKNKQMPDFLSPEGRRKASRKRNITRSSGALFAIILALIAGVYLLGCHVFQKDHRHHKKKTKTDRKEHRRGMPVRDNIVE